jgi:hypothetical protein
LFRLLEVEHVPRTRNDDELDLAPPIPERTLEAPRFLHRGGGIVCAVNQQDRRADRFDVGHRRAEPQHLIEFCVARRA